MLRRFFRPRWQHPDPRIRAEAVLRLDPADPRSLAILKQVVREDRDIAVRRHAVARLQDPTHLLELLAEPLLAETVQDRLLELLRHADTLPQGLPAHLLEALAEEAAHPQVRETAQARLDDPETRLRLLLEENDPHRRSELLTRLPDDLPLLERAHKVLRNKDKRLARSLQGRIEALRAAARLPEEVRTARQRLLHTLTGLRHLTSAQAVAHELQRLEALWEDQPLPPEPDQQQAWTRGWERLQAHLNELRRHQEAAQRLEEARRSRASLLETLEGLARDLEKRHRIDEAEENDARRLLALQIQSWADRPDLPEGEENEQQTRYQQALERAQSALERLSRQRKLEPRLEALAERIEALGEHPDAGELARIRSELAPFPEDLPRLVELRRRLDTLAPPPPPQEAKNQLNALRRDLAIMESALEAGRLHKAQRTWRRIQERLAHLSEPPRPLLRRLERIRGRWEELSDWQRWATAPQKEALIQEVEAMARNELPPPILRQQLKEARERWRKLGPAEGEEALRERFEAACAAAYEPVRAWREREREIHARNRARREEFLARLEGFLEQVDWTRVDWHKLTRLERDIHREWRELGHTDRASREELGPRFRCITSTLRERLEQEWERNRRLREALIEEARTLSEASDPHQALQQWRELQTRWRETGPVAPRQIKPLGRAFHEAGDRIVARWRAARRETAAQRRLAVEARETLLERMEAAVQRLEQGEREALESWRALTREWDSAPLVEGREGRRLDERQRHLQRRIQTAEKHLDWRKERDRLVQRLTWDRRLRHLEDLAGQGREAAGTLLQDSPPEALGEAFSHRWSTALDALESGRQDGIDDDQVRTCLVDLELALDLPSPPSEAEIRLSRQVARLTRRLSGEEEDEVALRMALDAWLALPPLSPGVYATLADRLAAVENALRVDTPTPERPPSTEENTKDHSVT